MKLLRLLGWIALVLLYCSIATLIIAATNGYLFNTRTHRFEQTATISVTVKQKGVRVALNNVPAKTTKPGTIKFDYLRAGLYSLEMTKDGYFPWVKTVTMEAGEVAQYPLIRLFLADTTVTPATASQQNMLLQQPLDKTDPDLDIRGSELWVKPIIRTYPLVITSDSFALISRFSEPIQAAQWLPGKQAIIFQVNNQIRTIDRDGANDYILATLSTNEATIFTTSNDGKTLIFKDNNKYWQRPLFE